MTHTTEHGIKVPPFWLTIEQTSKGYKWKCKITADHIDELIQNTEEVKTRIEQKIKEWSDKA